MKKNKKVLLNQEKKFLKPRNSKYIGENSKRDTFTLRKDLDNFNKSYELQMRKFKSAVKQNLISQIVGQTLIHDLSEQDFNKLVKIATHFYNTKQKDNIDKFDGLIENAVKIISEATARNPFLLDKLLYVYQGNFPQTYIYRPQIKSAKTK